MTASRRGLLTVLGAASVAGPALSGSSADAELIRLCGLAIDAHRAYRVALDSGPPVDAPLAQHRLQEEEDRLLAVADALWARADEIPATTREGVQAKAQVLLSAALRKDGDEIDREYFGPEAWSVVLEMVRVEGVA